MALPLRIYLPGITYHVFPRCIEQRCLMQPDMAERDHDRSDQFNPRKYDFELISYEIMDNHFHFIIRTREYGEV
jgi:REP element-mobilizing transposase RayT